MYSEIFIATTCINCYAHCLSILLCSLVQSGGGRLKFQKLYNRNAIKYKKGVPQLIIFLNLLPIFFWKNNPCKPSPPPGPAPRTPSPHFNLLCFDRISRSPFKLSKLQHFGHTLEEWLDKFSFHCFVDSFISCKW